MKKKWLFFTLVLMGLALLSQGCSSPPAAAEPTSAPTETDIPPAPTNTLPPPTQTAVPPTPTPTREAITDANLQRLSSAWRFEIPQDSFRVVAFSPDSQRLAAGTGQNLDSPDQKLRIWDATTGELLAESEKVDTMIWDLAYHPDGSLLAVGLENGLAQMRDALDLSVVRQFYLPGPVNSLDISPDGTKLAAGVADNGSGTVYIIDLASGETTLSFWAHPYSVPDLDFSPDGSLLATGAVDRTVRVWNSASGELLQTLPLDGQGSALAFSHDGGLLASGYCARSENYVCLESGILLWSTTTWGTFRTLSGPGSWIEDLAFSDADDLVAGVDRNGYNYFWRVSDGSILDSFLISNTGSSAIAISADGLFLATGSNSDVRVWQIGN
ncbi:MAG: WD40 repeat domain-containing protein [Anaerolineales bacterium]